MNATVETVHGQSSGFLLNLSCFGAMVHTGEAPTSGINLLLKCGPLNAMGKIAWVRDGWLGVKFDEPISGVLIDELQQLAADIARYATPASINVR